MVSNQIDLVVCSTRVDTHYKTIKPSIEAGKDVFVEWPLASNVREAEELAALANDKGVKTMVGLQGRVSPVYLRVKDLVQEGKIGKVLSSSITLSGGTNSRDSIREGLSYFFDRKVGGNIMSIFLGHSKKTQAPGPSQPQFLKHATLSCRLNRQRPRPYQAHLIQPLSHPPRYQGSLLVRRRPPNDQFQRPRSRPHRGLSRFPQQCPCGHFPPSRTTFQRNPGAHLGRAWSKR